MEQRSMSLKKKWIAAALALGALIACMKAGDGVGLDTNGKVIPFCTAHPDDPSCDVCVITPASKACSTSMCAKDSTLAWCHTQPDCNATPKPAGCSTNVCETNPLDPSCPKKTRFAEVWTLIENNFCLQCHIPGQPGVVQGKLNMESPDSAYANLVNVLVTLQNTAPGWKRVFPGQPDSSALVIKVTSSPPKLGGKVYGGKMPLNNKPMEPSDIAVIRKWIEDGALK